MQAKHDGDADPEAIPPIAAEQGGVFTARQALAAGWTPRQVQRRAEAGRWVPVAGKGLARPAPRWTAFQLAVAAQLTFPHAVTSHLTAARLYGWPIADQKGDPLPAASHVTSGTLHRQPRGMVVHRLVLGADEVLTMSGLLRVTTPERTAVDCLALLSPSTALSLWAWVRTRGVIDEHRLEQLIAARAGWAGTTRLRTLLRVVAQGAASPAEQECHRLLHRAGLTGWSAGATIRDQAGIIGVADILFHRAKLVIEIDGFAAHSSRTAFITDRRRQNRLVAAGYTVLRFTWDDLQDHPESVIAHIRNAL